MSFFFKFCSFYILFFSLLCFQHEDMSCKITESIFEKYNIEIPGAESNASGTSAAELISAFIIGDTNKLMAILGADHMFLSEVNI